MLPDQVSNPGPLTYESGALTDSATRPSLRGMQSFKKIYSVIIKLNRFFALHFFANNLYYFFGVVVSRSGVHFMSKFLVFLW